MNEYYIIDSNSLYDVINNGINNFNVDQYATDYNVVGIFNKMSEGCVPTIIKAGSCVIDKNGTEIALKNRSLGITTFQKFASSQNLEVIDPRELGINNKMSCMIYDIYRTSKENIIDRIKKVAQDLSIKHEDLSNYLSLVLKVAANRKNAKLNYGYIESKLPADKKEQFKDMFNAEYKRAKEANVSNIKQCALMSTMIKMGISE